jgi:hypothetical protein
VVIWECRISVQIRSRSSDSSFACAVQKDVASFYDDTRTGVVCEAISLQYHTVRSDVLRIDDGQSRSAIIWLPTACVQIQDSPECLGVACPEKPLFNLSEHGPEVLRVEPTCREDIASGGDKTKGRRWPPSGKTELVEQDLRNSTLCR